MLRLIVGIDTDAISTAISEFNPEENNTFLDKNYVDTNTHGLNKKSGVIESFKKSVKKNQLCKNAQEVISNMQTDGAEIHEITASMFTTAKGLSGAYHRASLKKRLKKNNLNFKSVQFCSQANCFRDKYMACFKLNVDVMIENNPEVAIYLAERGIKVLFFDTLCNKNIEHENIIRVINWQQCYDEYKKIRNNKEKEPIYDTLNTKDRKNLTVDEQIAYVKSYRNYIKNMKIDSNSFKKSAKRFKLIYYLTLIPFSIMFNSKKEGLENIPYQDGFIIASNHLDWRDQFFISRALGNRQFTGFAAHSIKHTIRGRIFDYTGGAVFIDRNNAESKKKGSEELALKIANDKIALIFPEGTRKNKNESGQKQIQLPFKLGTVSLAQKTGAPILPISLYHGKKQTFLKIGKLQFVKPEDNLIGANEILFDTIKTLTLSSMKEDT